VLYALFFSERDAGEKQEGHRKQHFIVLSHLESREKHEIQQILDVNPLTRMLNGLSRDKRFHI
jgi:hypothetical protein